MEYFSEFHANTTAAGANQSLFFPAAAEECVARQYFRVFAGGNHRYSFLYDNIIDSTFADGRISHANYVPDSWKIHGLRVGYAADTATESPAEVTGWQELTFNGANTKTVMPGEYFYTDPVELSVEKDRCICLEIRFSGKEIPCFPEAQTAAFRLKNGAWVPSPESPFPAMIGCDRPVKATIGYIGDSITQGIGVPFDSYMHWNAVVSEAIGTDYAFWNLGIGFARGADAATDGSWLFKAKQCDTVVVCFGVNDIGRGYSAEDIAHSLTQIVDRLHSAGCQVLLQNIPPFDYDGKPLATWLTCRRFAEQVLAPLADAYFDPTPSLVADRKRPQITQYGSHPNATGCRLWGEALTPILQSLL